MDPLKIAFCTNGVYPKVVGGMQRHSKLLVDELSTYPDVEITVLHPHEESIFPQQNVREIIVPGMDSSKNYLLERYRYSQRIYEQLKPLHDHLIYSQGPTVWYRAGAFQSRLIINPHGLEPFQGITLKEKIRDLPLRLVLKRLFRKSRYVVSLGGKLTTILEPYVQDEANLIVLPNAVSEPENPTNGVDPSVHNPLKALFVGRFESNKGIHILMESIGLLKREGLANKMEFYLAGKGPLYEKYKTDNEHANVHILGFVSDEELENLYRQCDVFVLPTLFEGMPTVVLEAMSCALPVIVTDVGATAELVSSANGYLIKKNSPGELKKALVKFIHLPNPEKKMMGENSLQKVRKRFTWDRVAQKHYELFTSLAKELNT